MSKVIEIWVAPFRGAPMEARESIRVVKGEGIVGDCHRKSRWKQLFQTVGSFFVKSRRNGRIKVRDVSFISVEDMREANSFLDHKFTAAFTRRNILTQGVNLNSLVGKEFWVGKVKFLGTGLCEPCGRPDQLAKQQSGLPFSGFKKAFDNRGGLRARVLRTGIICAADQIRVK